MKIYIIIVSVAVAWLFSCSRESSKAEEVIINKFEKCTTEGSGKNADDYFNNKYGSLQDRYQKLVLGLQEYEGRINRKYLKKYLQEYQFDDRYERAYYKTIFRNKENLDSEYDDLIDHNNMNEGEAVGDINGKIACYTAVLLKDGDAKYTGTGGGDVNRGGANGGSDSDPPNMDWSVLLMIGILPFLFSWLVNSLLFHKESKVTGYKFSARWVVFLVIEIFQAPFILIKELVGRISILGERPPENADGIDDPQKPVIMSDEEFRNQLIRVTNSGSDHSFRNNLYTIIKEKVDAQMNSIRSDLTSLRNDLTAIKENMPQSEGNSDRDTNPDGLNTDNFLTKDNIHSFLDGYYANHISQLKNDILAQLRSEDHNAILYNTFLANLNEAKPEDLDRLREKLGVHKNQSDLEDIEKQLLASVSKNKFSVLEEKIESLEAKLEELEKIRGFGEKEQSWKENQRLLKEKRGELPAAGESETFRETRTNRDWDTIYPIKRYSVAPLDKIFFDSKLELNHTPKKTYYRIQMKNDWEDAIFFLEGDPETLQAAFNLRDRILEEYVDITNRNKANISNSSSLRIIKQEPGRLSKDGRNWVVKDKAKVNFEE